tara:strand:+ start:2332 stop:2616 length:285 start_codon:yes stop_codon:yes gene_type:complete
MKRLLKKTIEKRVKEKGWLTYGYNGRMPYYQWGNHTTWVFYQAVLDCKMPGVTKDPNENTITIDDPKTAKIVDDLHGYYQDNGFPIAWYERANK